MSDMIRRVAIEMRRNRFARTRRTAAFDETVDPTEEELDDARAAIEALREPTDPTEEELDDARAAIEALREPTDEMVIAAYDGGADMQEDGAAEIWRAMIDEALGVDPVPRGTLPLFGEGK